MKKINLSGLLVRVFLPTAVLSSLYLIIGWFCRSIPHILLFCLIALFIMVPTELGFILYDSKREYGRYSLKSFLRGMLVFTCVFYGIFNVLIGPITEELFSGGILPPITKSRTSARRF